MPGTPGEGHGVECGGLGGMSNRRRWSGPTAAGVGGVLLAALLASCGDGGNEVANHASVLRRSVASIPTGESGGAWNDSADSSDRCFSESSGNKTPPFHRATTRISGNVTDYLDEVQQALADRGVRSEKPTSHELRWKVSDEGGEVVSAQLLVSNRSAQLTIIGPLDWCK